MRFNYAFGCEGDTSKDGSNTVNNVKYKSNMLLANQSSKFSAMASSDIPLLACSPEIIETLRLFNDGTREIHAVQTVVRRKHKNDQPLIMAGILYALFFSNSSCKLYHHWLFTWLHPYEPFVGATALPQPTVKKNMLHVNKASVGIQNVG